MDEQWQAGAKTSGLADLGPLPDVAETDSETLLKMFVELDEQHSAGFLKTLPSSLAALQQCSGDALDAISVQYVMSEARRNNRVCPVEAEWRRLHSLLAAAGAEPPPPLHGMELRRSPPLVRRIRVRDQVEWAAQHGVLREVLSFIQSLGEEQWLHMGD